MTTPTLDRSSRSFATDAARTTALIAGVLYRPAQTRAADVTPQSIPAGRRGRDHS